MLCNKLTMYSTKCFILFTIKYSVWAAEIRAAVYTLKHFKEISGLATKRDDCVCGVFKAKKYIYNKKK